MATAIMAPPILVTPSVSSEPVLYIVTREGNKIRAVGVGFDRSLEADLAAKASAQMARSLQQRL